MENEKKSIASKFGKGCLMAIGGFVVVSLAIGFLVAIFSGEDDKKFQGKNEANVEVSNKEDSGKNEAKWVYEESLNEMDDSKSYYAALEAEEQLNFDFPYQGGTIVSLVIRKTSSGQDCFTLNHERPVLIKFQS